MHCVCASIYDKIFYAIKRTEKKNFTYGNIWITLTKHISRTDYMTEALAI